MGKLVHNVRGKYDTRTIGAQSSTATERQGYRRDNHPPGSVWPLSWKHREDEGHGM